MGEDQAELLAIEALAQLAQEPDKLERFLSLSGIAASDIRIAAQEPAFLAGVLAFFMAYEKDLLMLAETLNTTPERIAKAHDALAGPNSYLRSI